MDIAREIGKRVQLFRKEKKMTLEALANAICKSKGTVSKYEKGAIAMDVATLCEIADALGVRAIQLLPAPAAREDCAGGHAPAFFAGLARFYVYYYDGRTKRIVRSVVDVGEETSPGRFAVEMYMNVRDYANYTLCEHFYKGTLTHYNSLSTLILENQYMEMDHYQIGIPSPYMDAPTKWGLAYGISSRPLMPTSTKVLLSKTVQKETEAFEKSLLLSKEDTRMMKLYNMLIVV